MTENTSRTFLMCISSEACSFGSNRWPTRAFCELFVTLREEASCRERNARPSEDIARRRGESEGDDMRKQSAFAAAILVLSSGLALAQTQTPANATGNVRPEHR
jgi:hypothetical protein